MPGTLRVLSRVAKLREPFRCGPDLPLEFMMVSHYEDAMKAEKRRVAIAKLLERQSRWREPSPLGVLASKKAESDRHFATTLLFLRNMCSGEWAALCLITVVSSMG